MTKKERMQFAEIAQEISKIHSEQKETLRKLFAAYERQVEIYKMLALQKQLLIDWANESSDN